LIKGIIFDFDGVIAQSVQVKTDAFATLYKPFGDTVVNKVIKHHEANGGISRFDKIRLYHQSFLNKMVTKMEIEKLAEQFSNLVVKKVIESPYVPGVLEYIQQCSEKFNLFISTGTPTNEMIQILNKKGINEYFINVYGSPEKKSVHLSRIMSKYNYNPNELIFYGDAATDIEAAAEASIPFVLVKNSFNKELVSSFRGEIISNFKGLS